MADGGAVEAADGVVEWLANEKLFVREYTEGHVWAGWLADRWRVAGLAVEEALFRLRPRAAARAAYRDDYDLRLKAGTVEVKSRREAFTAPGNYPYPTAFVHTTHGWATRRPRPLAVVLISRLTSAVLVVPTSTEKEWLREKRHDRVRGIVDTFLACPRALLRTEAEFLAWLATAEPGATF